MIDGLLGSSWDDPRTMGALQLAQGLLSAPKAMQGLSQGLLGYQQAMAMGKKAKSEEEDRKMRQQLQALQLQQAQQQMAQQQAQAARQQQIEQAYRGAIVSPAQQALAGGGGPTQANATAMQGLRPQVDQSRLIEGLMQADPIAAAKLLQPERAKIKEFREIRMPDGSVQVVGLDEFGQPVKSGLTPFKPEEVRDFGGFLGGIDPITGNLRRVGDKTMSAAERDASARGWAGVRQGEQRLALDRTTSGANKPPAGYRFREDGTLEAIPGGPADRPQQATEGERKAATLLARMEGSVGQLNQALRKSPGAAKPEIIPSIVANAPIIGSPTAANIFTSGNRQQVEAAQLDVLDAALTLGTGAAYTREQLEGYRKSYFPQIGDDPATIADKRRRLENVMNAARIAAGRAAPTGGSTGGATGGWSITPVN